MMKSPITFLIFASVNLVSGCKGSDSAQSEVPQAVPAKPTTDTLPGEQPDTSTAQAEQPPADTCGGSGVMSKSLVKSPFEAKVRALWGAAADVWPENEKPHAASEDTNRAAQAFSKLKLTSFAYTGEAKGGLAWEEQGTHHAFLKSESLDTQTNSKHLWGTLFAKKNKKWQVVTEIKDAELNCEGDLGANFSDVIELTDLDSDGQREVSFAYTLGCATDMSRLPLKLVMLEHSDKHTVSGETLAHMAEAGCQAAIQLTIEP